MNLSFLPAVNAGLNASAAALLATGFIFIRKGRVVPHRRCMIGAFAVSSLFLLLYVSHKWWKASTGQDLHTVYHGQGALGTFYRVVLISHLLLATTVPLLAVWLIRLGLQRRDRTHRRVARIAFPIWMYVSVTGVVIYLMLYHLNPAP
jgi:uncharacterized membrane protein YozB (DUF420 family)